MSDISEAAKEAAEDISTNRWYHVALERRIQDAINEATDKLQERAVKAEGLSEGRGKAIHRHLQCIREHEKDANEKDCEIRNLKNEIAYVERIREAQSHTMEEWKARALEAEEKLNAVVSEFYEVANAATTTTHNMASEECAKAEDLRSLISHKKDVVRNLVRGEA